MSTDAHLHDDVLERYAMNSLSEAEAEIVEDHIILCSKCLDRLDATTAFVNGMREALKERPHEELKRLPLPKWLQRVWVNPIWAGGALAAAGLLFAVFQTQTLPAPAMVVLNGTRGQSTVVHGTGPFDFELSLPPAGSGYHVELLDNAGAKQWEGQIEGKQGNPHAIVKQRVAEGQYFLQATDPVSGDRHEFGVTVRK